MYILLIGGGWSNEREISLKGVQSIHETLIDLDHDVEFLDPAYDLDKLLARAEDSDFAFINLHGSPGEDGIVQSMLDRIGCPYQGSDPCGSLLALNKAVSKEIFIHYQIPTPAWKFISSEPKTQGEMGFDSSVIVKPNIGGSSIDLQLIRDNSTLLEAVSSLISQGDQVLLEEYIQGEEITCAVLGDTPLPPVMIKPADNSDLFDFYSKYTPKAAQEICPAPISESLTQKIQDLALKTHTVLGLSDYSRTDFMVHEETPYALEVNTLPGMTNTSLMPQAAGAIGYSYQGLISELVDLGMRKKSK